MIPRGSWAEALVDDHFAPLGLKEKVLRQVREAQDRGASLRLIEAGLEWITDSAEANAERHGKPASDYIRRAVEAGHLLNYVTKAPEPEEMRRWWVENR